MSSAGGLTSALGPTSSLSTSGLLHSSQSQSTNGASVLGDSTRLVPANTAAVFEVLSPPGAPPVPRSEVGVSVLAPSKRTVPVRVQDGLHKGSYRLEFIPTEVGTHIIEVSIGGTKLSAGPLIAKVYDAGLIQVADVSGGVVGQPCQFRVDASAAGEGQLEISINEGEVPNHVQVVGGGRCLVSFTPDQAKPHLIDIKFNGETVQGCPFVCAIADTSRVSLNLTNIELVPVGQPSSFHMSVSGGGAAELAVSVRGPGGSGGQGAAGGGELPVKVTGDIHAGFTAEFTPQIVGPHTITVDYNGYPVQGTPFLAKAYDASRVYVGPVSRGSVGRPLQFTVDAGDAGEGNLEITISARGHNIPTQVHPQGNARFSVSFVPAEACEHVVSVSFNKMSVPGCPISVGVSGGLGGPQVSLPGPGPIHKPASLLINHSGGRLEDVEVNVEGPNGQSVPTQVQQTADGVFRAEFVPRAVGEHRVTVSVQGQPTPGSPYAAKVYDVNAIRVKEVSSGTVGKPVTFLVETSQAGPGNLEVTVNGGRVPTSAQAQGQHTYAISFTPREPSEHTVDLRFNGQDVPGSPFSCRICAAARVLAPELLDKVSVGRPCEFAVESEAPPQVEVLGPARRPLQATVSPVAGGSSGAPDGDGAVGGCRFSVKFVPVDVGDHSVEVRLPGGGHVEGSPFLVKAYSAERVTVTDISPGTVGKPVSFSINASQAGAGNLEIIVAVAGRNVPNYVQSEGNARFKVNFKPTEAATHSLSVRFNGLAVPGSPFSCQVSPALGPGTATVSGSGVKLAALGEEARILLEGFSGQEPQVSVTSPTGAVLRSNVRPSGDQGGGQWAATFRPDAVGRHSVAILHGPGGGGDMQHVAGSPFSCNVYDVRRVHVRGLEGGVSGTATAEVGKAVTFSVDAASAGEGTLELVVSTAQNTVKAEVVACARGLYDVTFVPTTREMHFVNITFNDAPVPGSPFQCAVQENLMHVQIGGVATIDMPTSQDRTLEIISPDGRKVSYGVSRGVAEFKTSQVGQYTVRTMETETDLPLAVRAVNVYDPTLVQIVTLGEGHCHRAATLGVSTIDAGQGVLSALVRAGGEDVPHSVRAPAKPGGNSWELTYHPVKAAPHKITLMYNGVPVSDRPIEVNVAASGAGQEVTAAGAGLYQARLGKVTSFSIDTLGRPAREFDVVVSGPGGVALPVRCYQTKSGLLQAEYTVTQIGDCVIEVLHQAKPLSGSPYTCQSFDPTKVTVKGAPHSTVPLYSPILLTVDHSHAGLAELDFSVTGPNGQSLPLTVTRHGDGVHLVELVPNAPGGYKMNVSYGGVTVLKTPMTFTASAEAVRRGGARAAGTGLELGHCGKEAGFIVYCPSVPSVQIESLDPSIASAADLETHIQPTKPGEWRVTYVPHTVGLYEVRVNCPGQGQVPGSPWELKVVDASQCHVVGGWPPHLDDNGNLKLPAKLTFDTSQCGPGELECILDGCEIATEQHGGKTRLALNGEGTAQGRCALELSYSGIPIPGAPQSAVAHYSGVSSGEKVVLTGRGLASAQSGETAHFTIDGTQAMSGGRPEVTLQNRDSGRPIEVIVTPAQPGHGASGAEVWHAQYTPPAPGIYLLGVTWAGRVVKGCPLTVTVSGSSADASRVLCSGEGLRRGVVGREIRSWIDTRRAGPGELTAHCAGPRKVAYCELYDHGDATFTLNVKPQEAGAHQLTIKYAGEHVHGSPFQLRVAGAPDASKVRVYGPGIEHGVLATFQSRFICDTRGAGAGQLTVRVRGPKGAFRVEMQRESQKDRTILCKFDPTEPGDYRVEVKWAGELVPGSPFPVMIFDTQEELRRFLHG